MGLRLILLGVLVAGCIAPAVGANSSCTFTGHYESHPPNPPLIAYEGHGWTPGETITYSANPPGTHGPVIADQTEADATGGFAIGVLAVEPGEYFMRALAVDCDLTASVVVPAQPTPSPVVTAPPLPVITLPPTDTE